MAPIRNRTPRPNRTCGHEDSWPCGTGWQVGTWTAAVPSVDRDRDASRSAGAYGGIPSGRHDGDAGHDNAGCPSRLVASRTSAVRAGVPPRHPVAPAPRAAPRRRRFRTTIMVRCLPMRWRVSSRRRSTREAPSASPPSRSCSAASSFSYSWVRRSTISSATPCARPRSGSTCKASLVFESSRDGPIDVKRP